MDELIPKSISVPGESLIERPGQNIAVVTNPYSGRKRGKSRADAIHQLFKSVSLPLSVTVLETSSSGSGLRFSNFQEGSAGSLASRAVSEGFDVIVAAGGDGTVSEVANSLVGTDAALGVLPLGTGNDFARTLGIGVDLAKAAECIASGTKHPIDVIRIGGGYCINIAGCGFDAEVATKINHGLKLIRGRLAYVVAVVQTLSSYKPVSIKLDIDGDVTELDVMLCAVANAQCYGGGMKIAPKADLSDGLLDVVVVESIGKLEFLRAFPKVFSGTHLSHPKVKTYRGKVIKIESESQAPVLADGEEIGTTPVEFEVVPKALNVLFPPNG